MIDIVRTERPVISFEALEEIKISPREREVVIALACGATNREVAEKLGISTKTIDTHRMHAIRKLKARNNAGLARYAIGVGWVDVHGVPTDAEDAHEDLL